MSVLAGPIFAIAGVLGVAGILKLARPATTAQAMKAAGIPGSTIAVRALAVTEIVVAAAAIAFGNALTATLLTVYYVAFAGFTYLLLKKAGTAAPCGCFGETEAPAPTTGLHVVLNLLAAAMSAAAIVWPTGGLLDVLADQPLAGIPFLALTAIFGWLWYLGLTVVPQLVSTSRPAPSAAGTA